MRAVRRQRTRARVRRRASDHRVASFTDTRVPVDRRPAERARQRASASRSAASAARWLESRASAALSHRLDRRSTRASATARAATRDRSNAAFSRSLLTARAPALVGGRRRSRRNRRAPHSMRRGRNPRARTKSSSLSDRSARSSVAMHALRQATTVEIGVMWSMAPSGSRRNARSPRTSMRVATASSAARAIAPSMRLTTAESSSDGHGSKHVCIGGKACDGTA